MKGKNIPLVAFLEVDGKRFPVKSWSENGCTLKVVPEELIEKPWNIGNLIVPFEGFDLVIKDIRLEIEKNSELKCHFRHLPVEQENALKSIINLYRLGEIFSIENLFNALKSEKVKAKKEENKRGSFFLPLILGIILGILTTYFILKVL